MYRIFRDFQGQNTMTVLFVSVMIHKNFRENSNALFDNNSKQKQQSPVTRFNKSKETAKIGTLATINPWVLQKDTDT